MTSLNRFLPHCGKNSVDSNKMTYLVSQELAAGKVGCPELGECSVSRRLELGRKHLY